LLKNRVSEEVEKEVVEMAIQNPAYGQLRVSNELKKKGIFISPGITMKKDLIVGNTVMVKHRCRHSKIRFILQRKK